MSFEQGMQEHVYCRRSEQYGCEDIKCRWNICHKKFYYGEYICMIMHCKEDRREIENGNDTEENKSRN